METLEYKGYTGSVESDLEDEIVHGKILLINDLVSYQAESIKELKEAFKNAVDDYIEYCNSLGKEPNKPFNGVFNVRVGGDLHRLAVLRAIKDGTKLNSVVVRALECYLQDASVHNHNHRHEHHVFVEQGPSKTAAAFASQETQFFNYGTSNDREYQH